MQRTKWIDMAKGIAIIAVVVGHTSAGFFINDIVFSFHMPLFFILAGYTFSANSDFLTFARKKSSRLLVPYFCGIGIDLVVGILKGQVEKNYESISNSFGYRCKQYAIGLGIDAPQTSWTDIKSVGVLWFIPCLFIALIIFFLLVRYIKDTLLLGMVCTLLSVAGTFVGKKVFLPWSVDISLVALVFLFVGYAMKETYVIETKLSFVEWFLLITIWIVGVNSYHISMNNRNYMTYIVPVITAMAASIIIMKVMHELESIKIVSIPLQYLGKNSLIIMIFHIYIYSVVVKGISYGGLYCTILVIERIFVSVIMVEVIRCIPYVNRLFGLEPRLLIKIGNVLQERYEDTISK